MIRHIYLFKLKDRKKMREAVDRLMTLKDRIPYMVSMEVGVDFKNADNSYELCELCTFSNKKDFLRFSTDPYHDSVRRYMDSIRESGIKIDYEIDDSSG